LALSTTKQPQDEALIGCDTEQVIFPKASVLPKSLAQALPAGVARFMVDAGVELDDELEESPPPPPQADRIAIEPKSNRNFILAIANSRNIYIFILNIIFLNPIFS
jgi:hypothetical protein